MNHYILPVNHYILPVNYQWTYYLWIISEPITCELSVNLLPVNYQWTTIYYRWTTRYYQWIISEPITGGPLDITIGPITGEQLDITSELLVNQ